MKKIILFLFLCVISCSFNTYARTSFFTTGLVYQNIEATQYVGSFSFKDGFQVQMADKTNFEMVGVSIGYIDLGSKDFGINGHLDVSQLSQGLSQKKDLLTQVMGSFNVNYSFLDWLYAYAGFNGSMEFFKMRSDTWKQFFGGVGWQYGFGFKYANLFLEVSKYQTTDRMLDIFGKGGTDFNGYAMRLNYGLNW
ncbi:MAG: hypothetical protein ACXVCY_17190 [Pseudobdellovibrionaceae bacterium]